MKWLAAAHQASMQELYDEIEREIERGLLPFQLEKIDDLISYYAYMIRGPVASLTDGKLASRLNISAQQKANI